MSSLETFSLSTDQVAALVELAKKGSLRHAAETLCISEQGVRNRLLALEGVLGVEVYRKSRGVRRSNPLTPDGQKLLPRAIAFLERARELAESTRTVAAPQEIHVAATEYMILYVLIGAVRSFHKLFPKIKIQLTCRTEHEIEQSLLDDPGLAFGVVAPYEASSKLDYRHLFSMGWSLITSRQHAFGDKKRITLRDLQNLPLILFERGSTGRQHVMDAFHGLAISPRVEMETTSTEIIVRMVEANLGVSIVPLMSSGIVTKGRRVAVHSLHNQIAPIHSGILSRRGERFPSATQSFIDSLVAAVQPGSSPSTHRL